VAQKSIMLWDPKGAARKPPKEAVPLVLSVERLFALSETFQQSVNPDFLLMTIGKTTRGAIERAFDWVIPIISSVPEIINRLPANASCFLLLRAYGEEGEGKSELRKLSAPLVEHVKKSLTGEFGESSAVRAADLLLADLADPNPDRRRCVMRVLRETLGHVAPGDGDDSTGLLCLLQVEHAEAIVSGAIKYISQGLAFERGRTLRALVIALDKYISFAADKKIDGSWNFASILCDLISSRYLVCSEAMGRFPDFRSLAITMVHREFLASAKKEGDNSNGDVEERVFIQLYPTAGNETANTRVSMPLALLQSSCVLLSICKGEENIDVCPTAKASMQHLADALMHPCDTEEVDSESLAGLASATLGSGDRAVTVEQVSGQ
jgi:integrator complex subunit 1